MRCERFPNRPSSTPSTHTEKDSDLESIDSALFSRASGYFPQAEGRRRRDASPGQAPKALPQMFIILAAIRGDEQVINLEPREMVRQALEFREQFGDYPGLNIKVPIGWNELAVIRELKKAGDAGQLHLLHVAQPGGDGGRRRRRFRKPILRTDPRHRLRCLLGRPAHASSLREGGISSEIIVGSIRHIHDVNDALLAGADIVTVPPKFFPQMVSHPKTDEAVNQFIDDFRNWQQH
jgi:transaldolase